MALPAGVDGARLTVSADARDTRSGGGRSVRLARDGGFLFSSLEPGTHDLRFHRDDDVIAVVCGITVRSRETSRDPRLQGVALGLRSDEFLVLSSVGVPLGDAILEPLSLESQGMGSPIYSNGDGGAQVITSQPRYSLQVAARGHRTLRLAEVDRGQVVRLGAGIATDLVLPGRVRIPVGYDVVARLRPKEHLLLFRAGDQYLPIGQFGNVLRARRTRFLVPEPGAYSVEMFLQPVRGGPLIDVLHTLDIEVGENAGRHLLDLEADALAAALSR